MQIDHFLELVKKRRSVREFKPDPIPDEYIEKILEAGRWAMSGGNGQPWEFIVVKDKETIREIERHYTETQRQGINIIELTRIEEIRQPAIYRSLGGAPPGFKDAPVIIVILGDLRIIQASVALAGFFTGSTVIMMDLANASQLMHVAAASLGLGSQWLSISTPFEGGYRTILGVPEVFTIQMMMPVGYPTRELKPRYRRSLDEIVHKERYEMSKFRSDQEIVDFVIKLRKLMKEAYPLGK
jgi:nitroreductase